MAQLFMIFHSYIGKTKRRNSCWCLRGCCLRLISLWTWPCQASTTAFAASTTVSCTDSHLGCSAALTVIMGTLGGSSVLLCKPLDIILARNRSFGVSMSLCFLQSSSKMTLTFSSCWYCFVVAGRLAPDGSCASLATTLLHHRAICEVLLIIWCITSQSLSSHNHHFCLTLKYPIDQRHWNISLKSGTHCCL